MPKCFDTTYARGQFFQFLAAPMKPNVDEMMSYRGFYGLDFIQFYPYGCVRTEDGHMFELLRNIIPPSSKSKTLYQTLIIQSTEVDGQNLQMDMEKMKSAAPSKDHVMTKENGVAVWRRGPGVSGKNWEIRVSEKEFSWTEEDVFSLSGPILNPAFQWYLPGPDYGTFYVNHFVPLEGQIMGRKASGFICFDGFYMHPDGYLYFNKDIMMENKGHILWYMFGTRYDDGSIDWGQFIVGNDRMGFGFFADSKGNCVTTNNIEAMITPLSDPSSPWTGRIDLTLDGEEWEFLPDPRGKMPAMMHREPPTPQQEGRWQRKGETRKPVAWFAWGETEKGHGLTRQPFLPTRKETAEILIGIVVS